MVLFRQSLLVRTIVSHLVVSMPPAFIVGYLVVNANRQGLIVEAQQVHLAVAARVADAIVGRLDKTASALESAERILDASELPFDDRMTLLRAQVAAQRLSALAIYDDQGERDSILKSTSAAASVPKSLPPTITARARIRRYGLSASTASQDRWPLAIAWRRDDRVLGFIAAEVDVEPLTALSRNFGQRALGPSGRIDVADGQLTPLFSATMTATAGATVHQAPRNPTSTPFNGLLAHGFTPALESIEAGFSQRVQFGGEPFLTAVVSVPELGWLVAVSRPEATALASVRRVKSQVGLLALIAALVAGVAALALARYVTEPILRLADTVRRIAKAGFRGRVDVEASAEVAELKDAFNEALGQLHRYRQSLRSTSQLRLKIARFLPPTALHDVLTTEFRVMEDGRRQPMTLMYFDLVASDRWSSPRKERLVAILCELYEGACGIVEDHGGHIDHFSGDSIIGIFPEGLRPDADRPDAHPTAALRAAVAIIDSARVIIARHSDGDAAQPVSIAIGVASGEAVMGGVEQTREVSVVGELVQTVFQLQQAADPFTAAVSPGTLAAADPEFAEHPYVRPLASASDERSSS